MIKTDEIIDRIRDFVDEHKILSIGIIATVMVLLIVLVLSMAISSGGKNKNKNNLQPRFVAEDDFVRPQDYTMTEDYYFSRQTEKQWSQEEVDKWFAVPSTSVMNELRKDNSSLVEEILGAAP